MKEIVDIIRLSTKESKIIIYKGTPNKLSYSEILINNNCGDEPQHLYVVDKKAPITTGVTVICTRPGVNYGKIVQRITWHGAQAYLKIGGWSVIVGTTDQKLIADGIPGISEQFIKDWVQCEGKGVVYIQMESVIVDIKGKGFDDEKEITQLQPELINGEVILSIESYNPDYGMEGCSQEDKEQYEKQSYGQIVTGTVVPKYPTDKEIEDAAKKYVNNTYPLYQVKEQLEEIFKDAIKWHKEQLKQ